MGMLAGGFISGGALLDFAPTLNGSESPATVGSSSADYEYQNLGPGSSTALANVHLTVENAAADCVINIVGGESGTVTDLGSTAQATTDILTLNERPDTVGIRIVSAGYTDSDHANYPSTTSQVGTFTDNSDFDPVDGVKYGYRADCDVASSDPAGSPPSNNETGMITMIVEFTFKKAGYNDLVRTYKVTVDASSAAFDIT